jgi:hypothetical protein
MNLKQHADFRVEILCAQQVENPPHSYLYYIRVAALNRRRSA